jgi:hypothetical protein
VGADRHRYDQLARGRHLQLFMNPLPPLHTLREKVADHRVPVYRRWHRFGMWSPYSTIVRRKTFVGLRRIGLALCVVAVSEKA